jgi:hypothetical protein
MSWNASKNTVFFQRLRVLADQMLDTKEEAERLISIADSESIVGNPAFVEVGGISPADAAELKGVLADYIAFLNGSGSLVAENRRATIDVFVADAPAG